MLGEQLRHYRQYYGFTQAQIARLLEIDRSSYTYYEGNRSQPDVESLQKLSKLYNVSIDVLVFGDTPLPQKDPRMASENISYQRKYEPQDGFDQLSVYEQDLLLCSRLLTEEQKEALYQTALSMSRENNC